MLAKRKRKKRIKILPQNFLPKLDLIFPFIDISVYNFD